MDKNDTNCLSSSKAHQHHQRFCQSLSASSGHWMVGRDGRCTSFSQCAFVHLCYRGGNQIRIRWSEQVPFWVRPLPRPLPGLSLGHRVGWGVAPVAAHAAARPPGLPQMLLAFKELWSNAWKSWNYIYIYTYIYVLSLRVEIPEIYMFRRWNLIHHPFSARSGVPADSVLIRKLNRQMGSEAQTFVLVAWQMWYQKFTDIWCLFVWKRFGNTSYINRGVNKKLSY